MKEITTSISFWEWFQLMCRKNKIDLNTPLIDETILNKPVRVTPRELYAWLEQTGAGSKSLFATVSLCMAKENKLSEFWTKWIRTAYENNVNIAENFHDTNLENEKT